MAVFLSMLPTFAASSRGALGTGLQWTDTIIIAGELTTGEEETHLYCYFCCLMAAISSFLSMLPTFASWSRKALGPGDQWPDPIIAALFANANWFAFGLIQKSKEAAWLNGTCGVMQLLNLGTYLLLCTKAKRFYILKRVCAASAYLAFTVWIGLQRDASSVILSALFCALSGCAAAVVPIITTVYADLIKRKTTDELPKWYVLAHSIFNGIIWVVRGLLIHYNVPMAMQNGVGAFCSLWLLVLRFVWDKPQKPRKLTRANSMGYVKVRNNNQNQPRRRST